MFSIIVTESALKDLRHLKKSAQAAILQSADEHLVHEPLKETRNRKPLRPNELSSWELRVEEHRIFYDVEESSEQVTIQAVGSKVHDKLYILGEEYGL